MALAWAGLTLAACDGREPDIAPTLRWYVFDEPSGAFQQSADDCARASDGQYRIALVPLPAGADQQREQLVRRLAAGDPDIDLIGMDVIWTAEFAAAGWVLPWPARHIARFDDRLEASRRSATWDGRLRAAPFTSNAQLLWYRSDRVAGPPGNWDQMLGMADALGDSGTIQAQGARYEGLTVLFISLLASAGGQVLNESGDAPGLPAAPTLRALELMKAFATSEAAPAGLANAREDEARRGFETGRSTFMLNYSFVWPSARENAPEVAAHMDWSRWPRVDPDRPSRVTLGGINLGVGAFSRYPQQAFEAAICLSSARSQERAARLGGLPPTIEALYDNPQVRETFPFADTLRATLRDAVLRPQTPLYNDLSLAISHTLHPMRDIDPETTLRRLREAVGRALRSEGLF